jgi:GTP-binding protein Era
MFHSGFIAIIGRPNAGKSTLVNALTGHKVAIVSNRPQTTRNRIQGIVNRPGAQVVLIDTPGLHAARSALNRQMLDEVNQALHGVDVLAIMVDASEKLREDDRLALDRARHFGGPVFLLLNKIDRIAKERLLPLMAQFSQEHHFAAIFPISALTGDGLPQLLDAWIAVLPENPPFFPTDQFTDQPERFLAAEFIREKAIRATREEIPHAVAVFVDRFEEDGELLRIYATLYVERDGQKGILIGKNGEMIKRIGTEARRDIEELLGAHVFLDLHVKVVPNWRERHDFVRQIDWRRQLDQIASAQGVAEDEVHSDSANETGPTDGPDQSGLKTSN